MSFNLDDLISQFKESDQKKTSFSGGDWYTFWKMDFDQTATFRFLPDGDPNGYRVVRTALFRHWCDGVEHKALPESNLACEAIGSKDACKDWWRTTWHRHGITECQDWMARFIARYKFRQALDARIPNPSRFHFDSEEISSYHGGGLQPG